MLYDQEEDAVSFIQINTYLEDNQVHHASISIRTYIKSFLKFLFIHI
jgi:hypothetical protein